MKRTWRFAPHDRALVARISKELPCSPLLAQVLAARGVLDGAAGRGFLSARLADLHPPDRLPGVPAAADRIVDAFRAGRRITIYGDYDVDGVTATSILWHCLKLAGANVDYYIPCRLEEGYGLNCEAIRTLAQEDPQRLVVTVDCGICSVEEAQLARELGMELIVTDHHTFGETLPATVANVHPRLPGGSYPFPDLCGAGVAFKLAWAICQRLGDGAKASPRMAEFLKSAVGLAALGTIADFVPLVGENRILVHYGLDALARNESPGVEMLLKVAGLDRQKGISTEDVGFAIAPRINAAGRLGQARLAVELLTTDQRSRAAQLADYLDQLNKNRQTVERRMFKEAKELFDAHPEWEHDAALVLASEDWHPGVVGIVASRVAERYQRPAILLAVNAEAKLAQGSGRTCAGIDLHTALSACGEHLAGFGGHRAAVGVRVRLEAVDEFRRAFADQIARSALSTAGGADLLSIDAEVSLHDLSTRAIKELDSLGPFGAEHRRPIFCVHQVELADPPSVMGNGGRHLSLRVRQGDRVLRCVAFGKAEWAEDLKQAGETISLCFSACINQYRGYESVELHLIDWKSADEANSTPASSAAFAMLPGE